MAQNLTGSVYISRKADGTVNALGKVYTYAAGGLTPQATYTTQAAGTPNTNPVTLDADGTAAIWLDPALSYRIIEKTAALVTIRDVDNISGAGITAADLSSTASVSLGDALIGVKRTQTGAVATTVHGYIEAQVLHSHADFGIVPDGTTSRTASLAALLGTLGTAGYRGKLIIPAGTVFDPATVFAATPVGVDLDIYDTTNWGQPPSYKNRFRMRYTGDLPADDSQDILASPHHAAFMLLNTGTATGTSAAERLGSILHGVGIDYAGDPLLGWLYQFRKDPSANKWAVTYRLSTPYSVAIADPQPWVTATVYAAGAYCVSDGIKIYKTTAGGTSGATAPTGTGTGISDGGVTWDYVQSALSIDATRYSMDEDGAIDVYGPTALFRANGQGVSKSPILNLIPTNGSSVATPVPYLQASATAGLQIVKSDGSTALLSFTDAGGLQHGEMAATFTAAADADTTPTVAGIGVLYFGNTGATSVTTLDDGSDGQVVELHATNGNTTLVHSSTFRLTGSANVTLTTGSVVVMRRWPASLSADLWTEVSRSIK